MRPRRAKQGRSLALAFLSTSTLDLIGNCTKEDVLDPQGTLKQTHSRVYNSLNRLLQDIGAANQTTQYGYDNNGNLTIQTDPLNQVTTNTYDKLNRLTDVQDPLLGHTETQYDPLDQVIRILDPLGSATDYTIDGLGDTEETDSPDTGITQRSFDAAGNVLSETDARGKTTTHRYDALNRATQTTFEDGSQITHTYDTGTQGLGRLKTITDPQGSTSWSYDGQGRPTRRRQHLDGIQLTVNYGYDPQGRLIRLTYPSGKAVTFRYDPAGRINRVKADGQTIVEQLSYHPFGPVTGWTWGNGTLHTRSLDLDGRISAYPLGATSQTVSYDPASRITSSSTKTYGYDALDRLMSVTAPGVTQTYSYDANGNRLTLTEGAQTTAYSYGVGSNRLESRTQGTVENYTYDPAGNLTGDGARSFTYDDRGRMVQATTGALTTAYRHNGLGERVSKTLPGTSTVSHRFVYDDSGHLIGEYDAAGTAIQETVYLGDLPIAILSGTNTIHYVHADQINTPRAVTDTQGVVVWRWESDAFGVGTPDQDPDEDGFAFTYNLRFSGQYFDTETGLHYNYFRDYDPKIGHYISSDPIGLLGGLNTYAYVDSNPLAAADRLGLAKCTYSINSHTLTCTPNAGGAASALGPGGVFSGLGPCKNKSSCANDKNLGPIQPGDFNINRDDRLGNERHWRLEPVPKVSGWKCYFGLARCGFKLHPGTLSLGCITADPNDPDAMKQYDQLHNLLQSEDGSNTLTVSP